ncbi:MAG TPA: DUF3592 domain-containing protein [Bryobacteraceae bacterium]|nr:DUF3592 domain-containing protein [Bryobacteraceae bacterium]
MKTRALWRTFSLILSSVGILLTIVGYFSYSQARSLLNSGVPARGVVAGYEKTVSTSSDSTAPSTTETTYRARVRFQTNTGRDVEFLAVGSPSPEYAVNAVVPVIYNPQNPSKAMLQKDASEASSFAGDIAPGGITLLLGVLAFFMLIFANKKLAWLLRNGRRISADFVRVAIYNRDESERYYVVCQWVDPDTNQTHRFTSEALHADPSALVAGKKIEVVMDPAKPKRYFVDLAPMLARRPA